MQIFWEVVSNNVCIYASHYNENQEKMLGWIQQWNFCLSLFCNIFRRCCYCIKQWNFLIIQVSKLNWSLNKTLTTIKVIPHFFLLSIHKLIDLIKLSLSLGPSRHHQPGGWHSLSMNMNSYRWSLGLKFSLPAHPNILANSWTNYCDCT